MTTQIERPTKEIKLMDGTIIILYSYITGGEKRAIESILLEKTKLNQRGDQIETTGVEGTISHLMQDKSITTVVKGIKKIGEELIIDKNIILTFLLNLPEKEYATVVKEINEITDPKAEATS